MRFIGPVPSRYELKCRVDPSFFWGGGSTLPARHGLMRPSLSRSNPGMSGLVVVGAIFCLGDPQYVSLPSFPPADCLSSRRWRRTGFGSIAARDDDELTLDRSYRAPGTFPSPPPPPADRPDRTEGGAAATTRALRGSGELSAHGAYRAGLSPGSRSGPARGRRSASFRRNIESAGIGLCRVGSAQSRSRLWLGSGSGGELAWARW